MARVLLFLIFLVTLSAQAPPELQLKRVVAIEYPWLARMAFMQGTVELIVTVSGDGIVKDVQRVSGPSLLADPTKETVSRWLFSGCEKTTGCETKIVISFSLSGRLCAASENCPGEFQIDLPNIVTVKAHRMRAIVN